MENTANTVTGIEPLENRVGENGVSDHDNGNASEMKVELHHGEDTIDDLDDEEVKGQCSKNTFSKNCAIFGMRCSQTRSSDGLVTFRFCTFWSVNFELTSQYYTVRNWHPNLFAPKILFIEK